MSIVAFIHDVILVGMPIDDSHSHWFGSEPMTAMMMMMTRRRMVMAVVVTGGRQIMEAI